MAPAEGSAAASGHRRRIAAIGLAAALAGCAPGGDFGRPGPSVVNDTILPTAGAALATVRGEPVSLYRMTDREREMRDLGWAIVMPAHEAQTCDRFLVELRRTRVLPAAAVRIRKDSYVRTLLSIDFRSSTARYARLLEDIEADTQRIEPFFQAAARVDADDVARRRALDAIADVKPVEQRFALARIEENALMIAWARESFEDRLEAYRYALDRLVLETPDRAAARVEQALEAYAAVLASLRPFGAPRGVFKS